MGGIHTGPDTTEVIIITTSNKDKLCSNGKGIWMNIMVTHLSPVTSERPVINGCSRNNYGDISWIWAYQDKQT